MDRPRDPDIGLCDWCGSDRGRRTAVPTTVTVQGGVQRIHMWLCAECVGRDEGYRPEAR